jgi:large subunit ribosomal protein L13
MEHTIDATNKALGRTASQAAALLMGKQTADFARNKVSGVKVHIINASKIKKTDKKMRETVFRTYTGYPGGLRESTMAEIVTKKGYTELFRQAVYGMLPTNKLRSKIIKNLTISE